MLRVERQRQDLERVLPQGLVVLSHIDEYTLLVGKLLILLQFIIEAKRKDYLINLSLAIGGF